MFDRLRKHLDDVFYAFLEQAIFPDEELLVWYDCNLPHYMGIPEALLPMDRDAKDKAQGKFQNVNYNWRPWM